MNAITAVYRLTCESSEVERLSREIAVEQTVEVPESLIVDRQPVEDIVGRVEKIEQAADGSDAFDVSIDYNADLSAFHIGQTLNLVYGNISLKPDIRLLDLEFPEQFLSRFRGPNLGVDGLRELLGVHGRPLLATALKPKGSSPEELAAIAHEFALGGGDLVKDDHNLVDDSFDTFRRRVECCSRAVDEAARSTGRLTLYLPNISARVEELEKYVEFILRQGIRGILIAPLVIGLDSVRWLAETYPIAIMAHPTFTGSFFHGSRQGMEPALLLGRLFRLIGCDCSIFPNRGGRFTFTQDQCSEISRALRTPFSSIKPSFPAPAGGMRYETLPTMAEQYGEDTVYLIGAALLGHSKSVRDSTSEFLALIRELFPQHRSVPPAATTSSPEALPSACEIGDATSIAPLLEHLLFRSDFTWEGREPVVYKATSEIPFSDVSRVELMGSAGEQAAFDVRYFEIAPEGFSSHEKHGHTHVIIGVRGEGVLISGDRRITVNQFDVAYVPPFRDHQLRNEGTQPFGFFCIVDHDRDRPVGV